MVRSAIAVLSLVLATLSFAGSGFAGEADIVGVQAKQMSNGQYRFDVSLEHADEGWDHYANKWDVVDPAGKVLATRILHHPHVNEQPFTRSISGVEIPEGIKYVMIRGHDSVHEYGGVEFKVDLEN